MLQTTNETINLAVHLLAEEGKDIEDYDGWCSTVSEMVNERYGGSIVYVDGEALLQYDWGYHMVPMVDGKIHDAWLAGWHQIYEPLPLADWLVKMFGTEEKIAVTIDGTDIYEGLPQNFSPRRAGYTKWCIDF